jgi:type VI secretion system secreted protein VgrG
MGKIRVEAEGDELQLLGQKRVTVQSHGDWVHITGKEGVLINGGGSYLKIWDGGIEYGTKAGWVVHARTHGFEGPRSLEVPYNFSRFSYASFVAKGKFPFSR